MGLNKLRLVFGKNENEKGRKREYAWKNKCIMLVT
jgi:hypothetical protein